MLTVTRTFFASVTYGDSNGKLCAFRPLLITK